MPNNMTPSYPSELHWAAHTNNHAKIQSLLEAGVSANERDAGGYTPIMYVNQLTTLQVLLDAGAEVNVQSRDHWTPLRCAVERNLPDVSRALLAKGAKVTFEDRHITPVIFDAIFIGDLDMAKLVIEQDPASIQAKWHGGTILEHAAKIKEAESITCWLLEHGFDFMSTPSELSKESSLSETATLLHLACFKGNLAEVQKHLNSQKLSPQLLDSLLHASIFSQSVPVVEYILKTTGANINSKSPAGRTPLFHAVRPGGDDMVSFLLKQGASPMIEDCDGFLPIDVAASEGRLCKGVIQCLLDSTIRTGSSLLQEVSISSSTWPPQELDILVDERIKHLISKPPQLTIEKVQAVIRSEWNGLYTDPAAIHGDTDHTNVSIQIDTLGDEAQSAAKAQGIVRISGMASDNETNADLYGQVSSDGSIWFVKLYDDYGWLYAGYCDDETNQLIAKWGDSRLLWHGSCRLRPIQG